MSEIREEAGSRLVSERDYIKSVRYLGLTTLDSIDELIDNSLDAGSNNIDINIVEGPDQKISIIVEDDGCGIPPKMMAKMLSFGGRYQNGHGQGIGKFGWGLSSAACCQTKRTELYSKTRGNDYHFTYIDLDELEKTDEAVIPAAIPKSPKLEYPDVETNPDSGTVVVLKDCDRLDKKKVSTLVAHAIPHIAETYRKYITAGKKISINNTPVEAYDPLMLTPGAIDTPVLGVAKEFVKVEPIVIGDVIDSKTNQPARVTMKVAMLDAERILRNPDSKSIARKYEVNMKRQGYYLIRNDRQIAAAQTLNLFAKHNSLNFFRAEVSFPDCLDEYFGVQTNKSRFTLNDSMLNRLEAHTRGVTARIAEESQKIAAGIRNERGIIKASERIAAAAASLLKTPKRVPTELEVKKEEEELKRMLEEAVNRVAKHPGLTEEQKEREIQLIKNGFQIRRPFIVTLEHIPTGDFYLVRPLGRTAEVVINTDHEFFKQIYEKATQSGLHTYLDLLIFTLAKAEMDYYDNEKMKEFYRSQKHEWSATLGAFLSKTPEVEEIEKEGTIN